MLKKVLPFIFSLLFLLATDAFAQPSGGASSGTSGVALSLGTPADPGECLELDAEGNAVTTGAACAAGGGATQLIDLTDVTAKSGNSTTVVMGSGPFTSGRCAQWDANGNAVAAGAACNDISGAVITDLSDVTAKSGNTTVVGTVAGLFTPGDCLEIDLNGNIVGTGAACTSPTHVHDAADVTTGTFADARIAQSNVTQHQAALSVTESQISDLLHTTDTLCTTVACAVGTDDTVTMEQGLAPADVTEGRLQWDTDDNRIVVGDGVATQTFHSGAHTALATTEAGMEAQLADVTDLFTNNDGALTDDDVSNDSPTDMLPLAHDTYLQGLTSGAAAVDMMKIDATNDLRFHAPAAEFMYWQLGTSSPLRLSYLDLNDYFLYAPAELRLQAQDFLHLYSGTTPLFVDSIGATHDLNVGNTHYFGSSGYDFTPSLVMKHASADNGFLYMCSGSTSGDDTGACIQAHADLNGFNPGDLYLRAANQAGAEIGLFTSGLRQWDVNPSGDLVNLQDNNVEVQTEVYGVSWDGSNQVPTKDAVYDKIETLGGGGGGGGIGVTYYDHTFTWPAGGTGATPTSTQTITHNVGRAPDVVLVYTQDGTNGWYSHPDHFEAGANRTGWDAYDGAANSDDNVTVVRTYRNLAGASQSSIVRLLWHTDDDITAATTGLKSVNGGAGANSLITYYNHNFTWPAGSIATIGAANIETVTHNVGRPPDKVVVYVQGSNGDWTEAQGQWRNQATNYYGWSVDFAGNSDEDNTTRVRLFSNEDLSADAGLVRLFWFSEDPIAAAVDGRVDIATSQGYSAVTASEVLTGDTFNGKAIYNKTLDMSPCPNATTKTLAHGVAGGIDDMMPGSVVMAKDTTTGVAIPFSHAYSSTGFDYWQIDTDIAGLITIGTAANRAGADCIAHLFYTKP